MALNFGSDDIGFNFAQSDKAEIGINKRGRIETATIVVALDGTGDFEDIQEAINSLNGQGGYIQLKEGVYKLNSQITLKKNIILKGIGKNTIIESTGNQTNIIYFNNLNESIIIENLTLKGENGNGTTDNSKNGINMTGTNCQINNCFFESHGRAIVGVFFRTKIQGNVFIKCYYATYISSGGIIFTITNNLIDYDSGGHHGFYVGGGDFCSIVGNCIFTSSNRGIETGTGFYNGVISGNQLDEGSQLYHQGDISMIGNNTAGSINLSASSSGNLVQGNIVSTSITDSGTNTVQNNI